MGRETLRSEGPQGTDSSLAQGRHLPCTGGWGEEGPPGRTTCQVVKEQQECLAPVRMDKCPGVGKSVQRCEPALGLGERALGAPRAQKTLSVKPRSQACPEGHPVQEKLATEGKFLLIIQVKTPKAVRFPVSQRGQMTWSLFFSRALPRKSPHPPCLVPLGWAYPTPCSRSLSPASLPSPSPGVPGEFQ